MTPVIRCAVCALKKNLEICVQGQIEQIKGQRHVFGQVKRLGQMISYLFEDGIEFELDLISIVNELLLQYPNPRLERQMRDTEEYFYNFAYDYDMFYDLRCNAIDHLCNEHKKILMASRIKRMYKRSKSDPNYKMCRDRLRIEFILLSTM